MGEGGRGRGVGVVVRGHVNRLQRGDRARLGRRDALLKLAHLRSQRWLVTHRGRQPSEKRGYLRASLGEPEDVVYEEQHVHTLVAEVLGHGHPGETNSLASTGRFVHLAKDHRSLVHHAGLSHLKPEVVTFAGPLTDSREYRPTAVLLGDVVDELLDDDSLADS